MCPSVVSHVTGMNTCLIITGLIVKFCMIELLYGSMLLHKKFVKRNS